MTATRRSWVWVVVAVAVGLALLLVAFAATSVYLVTRNMQVRQASPALAERELADARARFGSAQPLIRFTGREPRLVESEFERRAADDTGPPARQLGVMVFEPREGRLVRLSIPMWLVRLKGSSALPVQLGVDARTLTVSLEQFDRLGPALLVDEEIEGARVLIWTE
jgi:hypothetical protein